MDLPLAAGRRANPSLFPSSAHRLWSHSALNAIPSLQIYFLRTIEQVSLLIPPSLQTHGLEDNSDYKIIIIFLCEFFKQNVVFCFWVVKTQRELGLLSQAKEQEQWDSSGGVAMVFVWMTDFLEGNGGEDMVEVGHSAVRF